MAAICTCKVKVDLLNDSRYVKAIVILTFINLTTTSVLSALLQEYQDLINVTAIIGIFAVVITFLSLTFVPKVGKNMNTILHVRCWFIMGLCLRGQSGIDKTPIFFLCLLNSR